MEPGRGSRGLPHEPRPHTIFSISHDFTQDKTSRSWSGSPVAGLLLGLQGMCRATREGPVPSRSQHLCLQGAAAHLEGTREPPRKAAGQMRGPVRICAGRTTAPTGERGLHIG